MKNILICEDNAAVRHFYKESLPERISGEYRFYFSDDLEDANERIAEEPGLESIDGIIMDINLPLTGDQVIVPMSGLNWIIQFLKDNPSYSRSKIAVISAYTNNISPDKEKELNGVIVIDKASEDAVADITAFINQI